MFGGGNDAMPGQPADGQPADNTMMNAPVSGATPGDAPMSGLDTGTYGPSASDPGAAPTLPEPVDATPPSDNAMPAPPASEPTPAASSPASDDLLATGVDDDLMHIKQQALQQLSPIVGHLDQTPEEKFRTTMMMIQASDNQALIKDAYEAAQAITDEKVKAQALLDVINEINYFTQHPDQPQQ